jgi:peptidyl-prolyl cis-trans isomerase C
MTASPLALACLGVALVAAQAPSAPSKPVPATLPAVVARVNGQDVAKVDFEKMIKSAESNMGMPIPPEARDDILRRLLDQLVVQTLLEQEAKARGLAATDADVDARLLELRQRFKTPLEFDEALRERGQTLDALRQDIGRDVTASKLINAELAAVPGASDDEAKDFYAKNPDSFKEEETIRASHILIRVAPGADAATTAQAKATIESVLAQAKAGQDFAKLAREFSQDPTNAQQGGDLNYFRRGTMVREFSDAAFALQPGEVSGVVTTQFGHHIIKVTDRKPGRVVPFEEAAPRIKQYLDRDKKQDRRKTYLEDLKKKAKIEILI